MTKRGTDDAVSPSTTATTTTIAQNLLSDGSYDIEFCGYLSNHAKHAIVALDKLGASDDRIREYWNEYTGLTPYGIPIERVDKEWDDVAACTEQQWKEWKGRKKGWQEMVVFLDDQQQRQDEKISRRDLVRMYAPDLLSGMAGALTHGIIHLGWAIDADNDWMTKEGLAYLNFCYVAVAEPESNAVVAESDAFTSAMRIAGEWETKNLKTDWIERTKARYDESFHPELVPAGFQWQLSKVLRDAHPVATEMPSWLREKSISDVWEELYRFATLTYLAARDADGNGSFIALHLITSLWALEKVCGVIDDGVVTRRAFESYWAVAICTLCASSTGFPPADRLRNAADEFPSPAERRSRDDDDVDWTAIIQRGCAEREEHNIKLVYVTRELWNRYNHWNGYSEAARSFTLTPNIRPAKTTFG